MCTVHVSAVLDKSGAGFNLSATGAAQPEIRGSGFGVNSTAYFNFDNTNKMFNMVRILNVRTIFVVLETEPASMSIQDIFSTSAGVDNARLRITAAGGLDFGGTAEAAYSVNGSAFSASATSHSPALSAANRYIIAINFSSNQSPAATQRIGSTNFGGKIAEVLMFQNNSLTDSQRSAVMNYLNVKHGVY